MIHKSITAQRVLAAVQAQTTSLDDAGLVPSGEEEQPG
jgi:hypothetical protein